MTSRTTLTIICMAIPFYTVESSFVMVNSKFRILNDTTSPDFSVVSVSRVPFYKLLSYFTTQIQSDDPKVRELNIPEFLFYTHIYHAWMEANPRMSSVAVNAVDQKIVGANMVMELPKLSKMYAPGVIKTVLDFTIPCYESARPAQSAKSDAYISTLRASDSDQIEAELVRKSHMAFLRHAAEGSYHLVWSYSDKMNEQLERLRYSAISCRGSGEESAVCDWSLMEMHGEWEKFQCLFRFVKTS